MNFKIITHISSNLSYIGLEQLKTIEKTATYDKTFFLSKFNSFLNVKPVRSEIKEERLAFTQRDESNTYVISGDSNGKIGIIEFNLIPPSLLSTPPSTGHSLKHLGKEVRDSKPTERRTLWIVEVRLRKSLPRPFILAVEHFLRTWYGLKKSKVDEEPL